MGNWKYCDSELELKSKYTISGHKARCTKFKKYKEKI